MQLAALLTLTLLGLASSDICIRCKCPTTTNLTLYVDCTIISLTSLPSQVDYPTFLTNTSTNNTLSILDFQHNSIKIVDQFPYLPTVIALILRENNIRDISESAFINLANLKKLDLSHNELASDVIRPDVFRGNFDNLRYEPLNIETLDLGYNNLHTLSAQAFEHMPFLTELLLDNNPITIIDGNTEVALGMPQLKILNLGYTQLSTLPDQLMHSLSGLKELYLHGNNFEVIPESLAAVGTLERLNLNDNPMTTLDGNSFLGLHNLKELNISGCSNLTRVLPTAFSQLTSLQALHLTHNYKLEYVDKDAFRELKHSWKLKEISLKHNALSDIAQELVPWDEVEVLDLQENPWRCDCGLDWMVRELIPKIRGKSPELIQEIRCKEPDSLSGTQLLMLTSLNTSCTVNEATDGVHLMVYPLHTFVLVIMLLTGLVFALSLFVLFRQRVWKRREMIAASNNVKYVRQEDEEDVFSI